MGYFSETTEGGDGVWISGSLSATRTAGGLFSWQNDQDVSVLVDAVLLDVTTAATSSVCTVDVGYTATSATTSSDTMIDGADVSTTARNYNHIKDAGSNGKGVVKAAKGKWITASQKTGDTTGLVGTYYLHIKKVRT